MQLRIALTLYSIKIQSQDCHIVWSVIIYQHKYCRVTKGDWQSTLPIIDQTLKKIQLVSLNLQFLYQNLNISLEFCVEEPFSLLSIQIYILQFFYLGANITFKRDIFVVLVVLTLLPSLYFYDLYM